MRGLEGVSQALDDQSSSVKVAHIRSKNRDLLYTPESKTRALQWWNAEPQGEKHPHIGHNIPLGR